MLSANDHTDTRYGYRYLAKRQISSSVCQWSYRMRVAVVAGNPVCHFTTNK
jgi:phage-related protein